MSAITFYFYIGVCLTVFASIVAKHLYLVRYRLSRRMAEKHSRKWTELKEDSRLFAAPHWTHPYISKNVYDFIWRSEESLDDEYIASLRKKIRHIVIELPIFFVSVLAIGFLLIWLEMRT